MKYLQNYDCAISHVCNGKDAIELFAKDRFDIDIVITESILPDIDAFEMLIKFEYLNSDVPIIILTKSEDGEIMDRAISRCINEFFIKPINPNQLIIAIKRILYTSKIRLNRIGKKYSEFSTELNQLLSSNPCYDKWTEIYYKMCKWDLILDDVNDENLKQTHFLEKRNCNSFFSNFIDENYYKWINSNTGPTLSYDIVSKYVIPQLEDNKTVYFIVIDCMRYDQYLSMEPLIKKLFDVKSNLYYSILPTATPYSRNSLFS
ncbi:MAG TPA: response regulator, partial [Candidatus Cloacimonadota bacterium]|nr:response regulator [Candidatus Cloacimonadota bacterium]